MLTSFHMFSHVLKSVDLGLTALLVGDELVANGLVLVGELLANIDALLPDEIGCLLHHDWAHILELLFVANHDLLEFLFEFLLYLNRSVDAKAHLSAKSGG